MPGVLQPLDQKFAIVDAQGRPTDYFTRWAQQRQVDIGDSISLADLQAYLTDHALIEGAGIQFSPSGDLNEHVTIAADVQEILDQITATRGAILYRGLLGWSALLPGTSGLFLKTNGPGADPAWAAGGGGHDYVPYSPPVAANFPTVLSSATATDISGKGLLLTGAAGGTTVRGIVKTKAGDFTMVAALLPTLQAANTSAGIMIRDPAGGRVVTFGPIAKAAGICSINALAWNTLTSASADIVNINMFPVGIIMLRMDYVAATHTITGYISMDGGQTWVQEFTSTWVAAGTQAGFYVWSTSTALGGAASGLFTYYSE